MEEQGFVNEMATKIIYTEEADGGKLEMEGYAYTLERAMHTILLGVSELTGKPVLELLSEMLITQTLMEQHDCRNCTETDCEMKGTNDCITLVREGVAKETDFNDVLNMEFDLGDDNE